MGSLLSARWTLPRGSHGHLTDTRRIGEGQQAPKPGRSVCLRAIPKPVVRAIHQIPVFPCSAGNFGKTQSGTDFGKAARLATIKPLPHHAFPAVPSFAGTGLPAAFSKANES
jgi:hypothetical protein